MGGIPTPREFVNINRDLNINRDFGKFGKPAAETIVRNMRKRVAATRVEPGDRMAWLNLKLMSSVSPLALGSANNAA